MPIDRNYTADDASLLELLKYKERFKIALRAANICVFEVDLTKQRYTFFENAEDIFGISGEIILEDVSPYSELSPEDYQQAVSEYFSHPDDSDVIDQAFKKILNGEATTYQARMKAGKTEFKWCKLDVTPIIQDNSPVRMIGVITDINDMKAKTEILEDKTKHDVFTGLYNKKYSEEMIGKALRKDINQKHGLILFDIDNFKRINDTYGHTAGDQVLKSISDNTKKIFRKNDIIGRFGGDEFIILVKDIKNAELLVPKIEKLLKNDDNIYMVTKSIGVSVFPDDGVGFDELFEKADKALYRAKRTKNTYTYYRPIFSYNSGEENVLKP